MNTQTRLRVHRIALAVNPSKSGADGLAAELEACAHERNIETRRVDAFPVPADGLKGYDLCCVLGGDGSILGVVEAAARAGVPVLGFNFGALGFMANFSAEEARSIVPAILDGTPCTIDRRAVLECRDATGAKALALNDVVVKTLTSRLARLQVRSGAHDINDYYADGVIVATPTGSTAYNVSAGGPIVHPHARAIVLTPINPHTLSNRAIVLDEETSLHIDLRSGPGEVLIACDGRYVFDSTTAFPLQITTSRELRFPLIQHDDYSHFHVLRHKLQWTGNAPFRLSR
ncbi:MAG: NAD(+)/NADH kinase [Opitutales bacterium]|nr:NAD(+)/NADH kinase [Opitutales bacterium]